MAFQQITVINVSYRQTSLVVPVGRLALKDRKIFFEYAPDFLNSGLELSPFKLPLKPGVTVCEDRTFEGLFGVFNDSLPDGWGRLLLDRKLMKEDVNPGALTPLDRLRYVGARGMGALIYEPEVEDMSSAKLLEDLDVIAEESLNLQEHDAGQFIDELLAMNGSSAGARPKILINLPGEDDWIIKFRCAIDPKDSGPIEYAYHLMAKAAGLDVPEAKLFNSKTGDGYFGVKRFDHQKSICLHMHTISGLLHVDHRIPSLDYETVMKATLWLTKDVKDYEKQFRNSVFNVLAHNRDDHAKNFSYLMSGDGMWHVSPAYDLTFSSGPAGEHCTMVMGEGKKPGLSHLLKLAQVASINQQKALEIIDHVKEAVSKWTQFAKETHVSTRSSETIQTTLHRVLKTAS